MLEAAAVFFATAIYGALHSLLAASRFKQWVLARFGPPARRAYRLAYNAVALISFMPVLALLAHYPGEVLYRIALPWAALALAGQVAAMVLLAIGLLQTDPLSFLGFRQLVAGDRGARWSALVAAALASSPAVSADQADGEVFAVPFVMAAVALVLDSRHRRRSRTVLAGRRGGRPRRRRPAGEAELPRRFF